MAQKEPEKGQKISKEGFKKVEEPEVVKLEKDGAVSGEFVGIDTSAKFKDSWAVKFKENGELKVVFVNNMGKDLFISQNVSVGDLFILEHAGEKTNQEGTQKYNTYELYVKE